MIFWSVAVPTLYCQNNILSSYFDTECHKLNVIGLIDCGQLEGWISALWIAGRKISHFRGLTVSCKSAKMSFKRAVGDKSPIKSFETKNTKMGLNRAFPQ